MASSSSASARGATLRSVLAVALHAMYSASGEADADADAALVLVLVLVLVPVLVLVTPCAGAGSITDTRRACACSSVIVAGGGVQIGVRVTSSAFLPVSPTVVVYAPKGAQSRSNVRSNSERRAVKSTR